MAFLRFKNPLAAAPHIKQLPDKEVKRRYPWFRWRVMEATFLGYATFYLIRSNNLSVVAKDVQDSLNYSKSDIGLLMAITAATYGIGKFFMGAWSDRSDARKFMSLGLLLTALCNFAFGAAGDFKVHLMLWALNGLVQGMGWPPCGRSMGHWFSERERGLTFSIWNTSHNVGGGVAGYIAAWAVISFGGWQYAFYVPGAIALIGALYLFIRLIDTPQSVGLPPIEVYNNDTPAQVKDGDSPERELSFKELFVDYVLLNKFVWLLAFANFFAYVSRYSMLDWGPTYLREIKGVGITKGSLAVVITELAGVTSTILLGWLSDRLGGRRGMVSTLCMIPVFGAFVAILVTPKGMLWLDFVMLGVIGFFIYPVINLIVVQSLDLTSKKAIGTVAGFIGLVGYAGKVIESWVFGWMQDHFTNLYNKEVAWNIIIGAILGCTFLAGVLLAFTWTLRPPRKEDFQEPKEGEEMALVGKPSK